MSYQQLVRVHGAPPQRAGPIPREGGVIVVEQLSVWTTAAVVRYQELKSRCRSFSIREDGQGLVEYGLILTLVSVVAVAALTSVGASVTSVLSAVAGDI